jgi:NADH oxidase (H2O2-forming)
VDGYMRTSHPDVFAVGDCAEKRSSLTGKPVSLMLASVACQEARVAGLNLFETKAPRPMGGVLGIYLTYVGGKAFGAAGLTESMAKRENFSVETSLAKVLDKHPGSIPGAEEISLKLIYAKNSGLLIGAEARGGSSIAELINLLGLAIQSRTTVSDLSLLQYGTQPLLTASPVFYPAVIAALKATVSKNF